MQASRGDINFWRLFSLKEICLGNPEPHVHRVIDAFLGIGEAIAARWIQMPKAILLLQMAPDNPASGAIYLYDRERQEFYMLGFDGEDDTLTLQDFCQLMQEYDLIRYAQQPTLVQSLSGVAAA